MFKAHRLLYHSTLGVRVIIQKKTTTRCQKNSGVCPFLVSNLCTPACSSFSAFEVCISGWAAGKSSGRCATRDLIRASLSDVLWVSSKFHIETPRCHGFRAL